MQLFLFSLWKLWYVIFVSIFDIAMATITFNVGLAKSQLCLRWFCSFLVFFCQIAETLACGLISFVIFQYYLIFKKIVKSKIVAFSRWQVKWTRYDVITRKNSINLRATNQCKFISLCLIRRKPKGGGGVHSSPTCIMVGPWVSLRVQGLMEFFSLLRSPTRSLSSSARWAHLRVESKCDTTFIPRYQTWVQWSLGRSDVVNIQTMARFQCCFKTR